jgi:hypothetical protein
LQAGLLRAADLLLAGCLTLATPAHRCNSLQSPSGLTVLYYGKGHTTSVLKQ